jgi:hypothetical protein
MEKLADFRGSEVGFLAARYGRILVDFYGSVLPAKKAMTSIVSVLQAVHNQIVENQSPLVRPSTRWNQHRTGSA